MHDHCHCQISLLLENLDRFRRLADITVSPKNFDLRCSNPFESDVVISISFILQSSYWTAETCGTCGSDGSDSSRLPLVWDPSQGAPKSASKCVSAAYGAYGASPSHAFSFASQRRCVSLYNIYIYAQWLSIVDFKESPWSLCLLSHPVKRRSVDQSIKYDPSMVLISSDRLEVKILMAPDGSWGSSGCRRISWCLDTWKGH